MRLGVSDMPGARLDPVTREAPPCKGCKDRHEACWGGCDKYKYWKEMLEGLNEKRREYDSKPFVRFNPFNY